MAIKKISCLAHGTKLAWLSRIASLRLAYLLFDIA
jgi:hypothetical protein